MGLGYAPPPVPEGTWCFVLAEAIDPSKAIVVVSVEGAPASGSPTSIDSTQWVAGAPDCYSQKQIEIRTVKYTVQGGALVAEPNGEIPFSFVVP